MAKELKEYRIKVPVYVSELIDKPNDLFGGISYQDMVKSAITKIDEYNSNRGEIKKPKRNKTFEKHIKGIEYQEYPIGSRKKGLLLKITSFNTNLIDGFFEEQNKIQFTKASKVGSDNNFLLLYPNIYGLDPNNYRYQWIILLYEDPNKENADIVATAKIVLKDVLRIDVKNIKLKTVIENLRQAKYANELQIKLVTQEYDVDKGIPHFHEYLVSSKTKTINEYVYTQMPAEAAINLINKENFITKGLQAIKRIFLNNREYKITQTFEEEAEEKIKEIVEEIYNSDISISEDDLQNRLYDTKFVMDKLIPILTDYLKNIENDESGDSK